MGKHKIKPNYRRQVLRLGHPVKAKRMARQIQQSSDLWDLEHYLTRRLSIFAPRARVRETFAREETVRG